MDGTEYSLFAGEIYDRSLSLAGSFAFRNSRQYRPTVCRYIEFRNSAFLQLFVSGDS